jgi:DNA-binding response OmpR family regulator
VAICIMVVNDTQEILELFREILLDEGYDVVLYSFAIQEMNEVERVMPDLIILDCLMGAEQQGWQMLQKLKMRRATDNIPVVICTAAKKMVEEIQGFLTAKRVVVVYKPFLIDELLVAVAGALKLREEGGYIETRTDQLARRAEQKSHEEGVGGV